MRIADFNVRRTGYGRARIDQIDRIQHARAIFALVAARPVIAAMRTGADHIPVRQKFFVRPGIDLFGGANIQMTVLPKLPREMLRQFAVLQTGRTAKMIPGQAETFANLLLAAILFGAKFRHIHVLLRLPPVR